ncbi:hypothetical protein AHAS_Ahas03G0360500 [Arachis hypogaea]
MEGLKPVILMVLLQILYAALNVLYKLAIFDGMSMRVASAYRLIFASAFTLPLALFFDRNNPPRITSKRKFISQPLFCRPVSVARDVHVGHQQPCSGCHLCYGHNFPFGKTELGIRSGKSEGTRNSNWNYRGNGVKLFQRDWTQWRLGWNIRLLTVAYAGIVASGIVIIITAWCIKVRGPLFASIFNPLQLLLVAIVASLILNENLYLGSVVGGVVIVIGLYTVLWGKSKEIEEKQRMDELMNNNKGSQVVDVDVVVRSPQIDDHQSEQHNNI